MVHRTESPPAAAALSSSARLRPPCHAAHGRPPPAEGAPDARHRRRFAAAVPAPRQSRASPSACPHTHRRALPCGTPSAWPGRQCLQNVPRHGPQAPASRPFAADMPLPALVQGSAPLRCPPAGAHRGTVFRSRGVRCSLPRAAFHIRRRTAYG